MKAWRHQEQALPRLLEGNYLLLWDAGVGKTLPLLTAAKERGGRALYLGPPAIRTQVAREAQVFGLYAHTDIQVVLSGKDRIAPQAKLVICSYDHLIDQKIWKQLFNLDWRSMILDEGHLLKNTEAKRTRAVYGARINSPGALYRKAERVWVATGTPLVNDPSDLWPHLSRLMPTLLKLHDIENKAGFIEKFCHVRQTPYGPVITGGKNLPELRSMLADHVSRVRKTDVLDLPPLNLTQLWVPATDLDLDGIPDEALAELEAIIKKDDVAKLERLVAPLATLRRRIGLAKAKHCAEMALTELASGVEKTIIFYQHTEVGKMIADEIGKRAGLEEAVLVYQGGMANRRRDEIVKQFTTDPSVRVLVAQIQAAGTGLNLQAADRVMVVEPAWTPALNEQAISRAYRAGQKRRVWASFVCLENSIDERVTYALLRKQRIIEGAIG